MEEAVLKLLGQRGEAKIGDLEVASGVKEEVLRLQVAVCDAVAVAEAENEMSYWK